MTSVDPWCQKLVSDLAKALEIPKREPRTVQEISEALSGRRLAASAAQETETGRTESLKNLAALADLGSEAET